jgi:hypothetical protein
MITRRNNNQEVGRNVAQLVDQTAKKSHVQFMAKKSHVQFMLENTIPFL